MPRSLQKEWWWTESPAGRPQGSIPKRRTWPGYMTTGSGWCTPTSTPSWFDLVEPGLVYIPQWRPDAPQDVPDDPGRFWGLVGVGIKR